MNESLKVQPHHLERGAYLYVRQSSMRQVMENIESTKRQHALRGRAIALGWRDDQIIVIDNDQGESGASAAWREGFQRLVTDVGMGHAGIVMGLEVSRLARNNADWHRLLEICALADTLILDEDGVYDPASSTTGSCWVSIDLKHKTPLVQLSCEPDLRGLPFDLGPERGLFFPSPSRRQM